MKNKTLERLKQIRINSTDFHRDIVTGYALSNLKFPFGLTPFNLEKDIKDAVNANKLELAMMQLYRSRDLSSGIVSMVIPPDHKDHIGLYLRDARFQLKDDRYINDKVYWQDYAGMGLNYIKTLRFLVEVSVKDEDLQRFNKEFLSVKQVRESLDEKLRTLAQAFITSMINSPAPVAQFGHLLHSHLAPLAAHYMGISSEEAKKRLNNSLDFPAFNERPYAISTILRVPGSARQACDEFILSEPMMGLTDTQIEELNQRSKQRWYCAQPDYIRKMIDAVVPKIKEGRLIPALLKHQLPSARNCYCQQRYIVGKKWRMISTSYRSGTLAHFTAGQTANQRFTQQTLEQLSALSGVKQVNINSLVTPRMHLLPAFTEKQRDQFNMDHKATWQMRTAADRLNSQEKKGQSVDKEKETQYYFSNTPINFLRFISKIDVTGIEQCFDYLDRNIAAYFPEKHQQLLYQSLKRYYTHQKRKLGFFDVNNRNLKIAAIYNLIVFLANQSKCEKSPEIATFTSCMSGRDREGILMELTDSISSAITRHQISGFSSLYKSKISENPAEQAQLINELHTLCEKHVQQLIDKNGVQLIMTSAKAGHNAVLSGSLGGTRFCNALKSSSRYGIPINWPKSIRKTLFSKTSNYNNRMPRDPKMTQRTKWGMVSVFALGVSLCLIALSVGPALTFFFPLLFVVPSTAVLFISGAVFIGFSIVSVCEAWQYSRGVVELSGLTNSTDITSDKSSFSKMHRILGAKSHQKGYELLEEASVELSEDIFNGASKVGLGEGYRTESVEGDDEPVSNTPRLTY